MTTSSERLGLHVVGSGALGQEGARLHPRLRSRRQRRSVDYGLTAAPLLLAETDGVGRADTSLNYNQYWNKFGEYCTIGVASGGPTRISEGYSETAWRSLARCCRRWSGRSRCCRRLIKVLLCYHTSSSSTAAVISCRRAAWSSALSDATSAASIAFAASSLPLAACRLQLAAPRPPEVIQDRQSNAARVRQFNVIRSFQFGS